MTDNTQPSTAQLLELVNVQMAAEAFLGLKNANVEQAEKEDPIFKFTANELMSGNDHSTKFTSVTATDFVSKWEVKAHQANTTTGFSGTLFQAKDDIAGTTIKKGDQVISFRSTEFIEDTLHDNRATNTFEIKEKGWAFGQIADMQTWFQQLKDSGTVHGGLTVTGYSLGGHLATAFSLLHPGMIDNTYTFNGAGAGFIIATDKDGNPILDANGKPVHTTSLADTGEQLGKIIEQFNGYRTLDEKSAQKIEGIFDAHIKGINGGYVTEYSKTVNQIYHEVKDLLGWSIIKQANKGGTTPDDISIYKENITKALDTIASAINYTNGTIDASTTQQLNMLLEAVTKTQEMANEYIRANNIFVGTADKQERIYHAEDIEALNFDYRLAVVLASRSTEPLGVAAGAMDLGKDFLYDYIHKSEAGTFENFYNVWASPKPSMVSTSQQHFGKHDVLVGIEDQPLIRGDYIKEVALQTGKELNSLSDILDLQLLVPDYDTADFGDTHSIILMQDALMVQNLISKLDDSMNVRDFADLLPLVSNGKVGADLEVGTLALISGVIGGVGGAITVADLAATYKTDTPNKQGLADGDALESLVTMLSKTLGIPLGLDLKGNPNGATWTEIEDKNGYTGRDSLQRDIVWLKNILSNNQDIINKVNFINIFDVSEDVIKQTAKNHDNPNNFSLIIALETQSPFIIQPKAGESLDNFWKNNIVWKDKYESWKNQDNSEYTAQWVDDRYEMLQWQNVFSLTNRDTKEVFNNETFDLVEKAYHANYLPYNIPSNITNKVHDFLNAMKKEYANGKWIFTDMGSNKEFKIDGKNSTETDIAQHYTFGDKNNDTIQGDSNTDHLYGGEGDDTLTGKGGNDLIYGGKGADKYYFNNGDGTDNYYETKGNDSQIYINGKQVTTLRPISKEQSDQYESPDHTGYIFKFTADGSLQASTTQNGQSGTINLHDFDKTNNNYGITFEGYNHQNPDKPVNYSDPYDAYSYVWGGNGDDYIQTGTQRDWAMGGDGRDYLDMGSENDEALGGGDADTILGGSGNDMLYGGGNGSAFGLEYKKEDNDYVVGGDGNDLIMGGVGNDILIAGSSKKDNSIPTNLQLEGATNENQGDWLEGGEGEDQLWGSGGRDMLTGGVGGDEIHGNGENDIILGDGDYSWQGTSRNLVIIADPIIISDPLGREHYVNNTYPNHPFLAGYYDFEYAHEYGVDGMKEIGYILGSYNKNTYLFNVNTSGDDFVFTPAPLKDPRSAGHYVRVMQEPTDGTNENNIDVIYGDDGDDWIAGQLDTDYIHGGNGNDKLYGDDIEGVVLSKYGDDFVFGEQGDDTLYGGKGNDYLDGGEGKDKIYGGDDNDLIGGGNGDDEIEGNAGNDSMMGDAGIDTLKGGEGDDIILGGDGDDTLKGEAGNDFLQGDKGADTIDGGEGEDIILGGEGDDTLTGGSGKDTYTFVSGDGRDQVNDQGENTLNLSKLHNNDIMIADGRLYYSIDEKDSFNFSTAIFSYVTTADGGYTATDFQKLASVVEVVESPTDATIDNNHQKGIKLTGDANTNATGNDADNTLYGNTGNNILNGGGGKDLMQGREGDDTYYVDNIGDVIIEEAGQGIDKVYLNLSTDNNITDFMLAANVETLVATAASAPVILHGNQSDNTITANGKNNTIYGDSGNDTIYAGQGADTIEGGDGNDTLYGEMGDDILKGGNDNDILNGGVGTDTLIGGEGNDTYIFKIGDGNDQIIDSGENTLDLSTISNKDLSIVKDNLFLNRQETDSINFSAAIFSKVITADGTYTAQEFEILTKVKEIVDSAKDAVIDTTINKYQTGIQLTGNDNSSATGDDSDNILYGNIGNNVLNGAGGNDLMQGGLGDDTYYVNTLGDVVKEMENAGNDSVELDLTEPTNLAYTLPENVEILHATYQNSPITISGNDIDNEIYGNEKDNIIDGGLGADIMVGDLGNDTYNTDNIGDSILEETNGGVDTVNSTIDMILTKNVEKLNLLNSAIQGIGNTQDNEIVGNANNNMLDGDLGADVLKGGLGDDVYIVDSTNDKTLENTNEGIDTVQAKIDWTLQDNTENLTLMGNTTKGIGNALNNILVGNSADNILDGKEGQDTLRGLAGNDKYLVDNPNDKVEEADNNGIDEVVTTLDNYTLAKNVEKLTFGNNVISGNGNELDNTITGNEQDNTLNGGLGDDILIGGRGNDTYIIMKGQGNDVIQDDTLSPYGWYDTDSADKVISDDSIDLNKYQGIEIGQLVGADNLSLKGRYNRADTLIGNEGNNILYGSTDLPIDTRPPSPSLMVERNSVYGHEGNYYSDKLIGGKGNDIYILYSDSDSIIENANEGNDTIQIDALNGFSPYDDGIRELKAFISIKNYYEMNANIENLILSGDKNFDIIGNSSNNKIIGNTGNNKIDGMSGNDDMQGGLGDDIYIIDSVGDKVLEINGEGQDRIDTSVSITQLFANVENANLLGANAINITGNDLDNFILGNTGNNIINGANGNDTLNGNLGDDTLTGGVGKDKFIFNTDFTTTVQKVVNGLPQITKISNLDTITDFSSEDTIVIDHKLLNMQTTGILNKDNFVAGSAVKALDSNDFILYDTSNGKLYYDSNGSASGGLVQFATLSNRYNLTCDQITII